MKYEDFIINNDGKIETNLKQVSTNKSIVTCVLLLILVSIISYHHIKCAHLTSQPFTNKSLMILAKSALAHMMMMSFSHLI